MLQWASAGLQQVIESSVCIDDVLERRRRPPADPKFEPDVRLCLAVLSNQNLNGSELQDHISDARANETRSQKVRRWSKDPRFLRRPDCHCAKERRGESSEGSSPSDGGLNGLPPQVTVCTRSALNQISILIGFAGDAGSDHRPLATAVSEPKAGSSALSGRMSRKRRRAGFDSSHLRYSNLPRVPGTSPARKDLSFE